MPVLEFALDAISPYRVQVHLNTRQGPVSVMFNRNVVGSLITIEEQHAGKDFRLPDSSLLRVSVNNGQAQAWRNGQPLLLTSAPHSSQVTSPQERRLGGGVMALLILNVLASGALLIWFCLDAYLAAPSSSLFFPRLGMGLSCLFGLIGLFTLLAWKRWGLYLMACSAVANLALSIIFGIMDYLALIPLAGLIALFVALRSSGLWRKLN